MEAVAITKNYGKKKVLREISFRAEKGKCTGFIGANGCGKSTLFRILSGVEKADGGSVIIDGNSYSGKEKMLAGKVGYVPQENALMEELTVWDNIRLFVALGNGKCEETYIHELCRQFYVHDFAKERVGRLSGGMKKRVSIVCALVNKPEILIMDEPSAALDLLFKEELKNCISDFTKKGGSVLLSSHDQGEILSCDRLYALKNGSIYEVDTSLRIEEMVARYMK